MNAAQRAQRASAFSRVIDDTRGASYVEYLIIVGVVALAAQTGFRAFGNSVADVAHQQAEAIGGIETGSCVGGLCIIRDKPQSGTIELPSSSSSQ